LTNKLFYAKRNLTKTTKGIIMARICDICGKKSQKGMKVSHAHNRSIKHFQPNLKKIRTKDNTNTKSIMICTRCL